MTNRITALIPSKDEARKLLFEFWKYLLIGLLGLVALVVPVMRSWIIARIQDVWRFAWSDISLHGWTVIVGLLACVYAVVRLLIWLRAMIGPAYVRRYTEGDYNGIHWKWRWRKRRVDKFSMVPLCPSCSTELDVHPVANQYDGQDTSIYCTTCNKASRITNVSDLPDHIRRKIEGDATTGRWKAIKTHDS